MITYGTPDAPFVLLQMVDDHDLAGMESEAAKIQQKNIKCCIANIHAFIYMVKSKNK